MGCSCGSGSMNPQKTGGKLADSQSHSMGAGISGFGENDIVFQQGTDWASASMCRTLCHEAIIRCLKMPNQITVEDGATIAKLIEGDRIIISGLGAGCVDAHCAVVQSVDVATRTITTVDDLPFLTEDVSYVVGGGAAGGALANLAGCSVGGGDSASGRPQLFVLNREPVTYEGFLIVETGRNSITLKVRSDAAGSDVYLVQPTGVVKAGMSLVVEGDAGVVLEHYGSQNGFDIVRLDRLATEAYECRLGMVAATPIEFKFSEDACGCVQARLSWRETEKIIAPATKGCATPVKVGRYLIYEVSGKGTVAESRGGCVESGCVWVIPGLDYAVAKLAGGNTLASC
jgi:hypothetical protein